MLKVYGVGTVVVEPKLRKIEPSNTHVCNLRLAFNDYIGSGENRKVESHYFDFVLWDTGAEAAAKKLAVGDRVYVEAEAKENRYTDDKGVEHYRVVFRVKNFTPIPKQAKPEAVEVK